MIVNIPFSISDKAAAIGLISLFLASIGIIKSGLPQLVNSFLNDGLTIRRQKNQERSQAELALTLLKDEINENINLLQEVLKVLDDWSECKEKGEVGWYQRAWEKYSSVLNLAVHYDCIGLSQFRALQNFYRDLNIISEKHSELVRLQFRLSSFKKPYRPKYEREDMRILLEGQDKIKEEYQQKPGQSEQEFLESLLVAYEPIIALGAHQKLKLHWEPKLRGTLKQLIQNLLHSGNPIA